AAVLALGGLTYGIIEGGAVGYDHPQVVVSFALAVVAAVVFVVAQAAGRHPMVPLDLFRSPTIAAGLSIAFVTTAAYYGVVFVQSLYFQQVRGEGPFMTGLLFLPMTGLVAVLTPVVARAMERCGRFPVTIGGQLVMALGMVGLALLTADAPVWAV